MSWGHARRHGSLRWTARGGSGLCGLVALRGEPETQAAGHPVGGGAGRL